jgi:hypothetical protein
MKLNCKCGFKMGAVAAVFCAGLFAAFWFITLPPPGVGDSGSIRRWWNGPYVSAHLSIAAGVFVVSGLLGFVLGAFRPATPPRKSKIPNRKS